MMIARLKKLEATETGAGYAMGATDGYPMPGSAEDKTHAVKKPQSEAELRMLSVPRDGWVGGPGRHFSFG